MEPSNFKRYTITSALPYANGPLHIGHLAGAYLPADSYVRYLRLLRKDVVYLCGSDEHGAAITIKAKKEGTTPTAIIDKYHEMIRQSFEDFGIAFDIYHRTSSALHHRISQEFFLDLYRKNAFTEHYSEQYYDADYDQFLADRYIIGTCPNCGNENAYGDQCEKCGSSLSPTDLIHPKSTLSGKAPVLRPTKHWYLPLDNYQPWLEKWLLQGKKDSWKTNVYGQCSSWLKQGLQPRSMTRDLDWGVDVPLDDAKGKKLYVWLDAPIGYISATQQWASDTGKNWELYWKSQPDKGDDACLIHFIGKDNIVFHCITFPSILHAHGEYILPENVPANEFLNLEGEKISTSRNHAVWLHEYLADFPGKQDELRYVLTSILPETSDSEFTWKDYQARVNNELVAIFGNFVNRVLVLMHKYFDGRISGDAPEITDPAIQAGVGAGYDTLVASLETFRFRQGLAGMMDVARLGNKYLTEEEPWKRIKTDPEKTREVLHNCLHISAHLGCLAQAFLPATAKRIFALLNLPKDTYHYDEAVHFADGHQLSAPELLFAKVEDDVIEKQLEKLKKTPMEIPQEQAAAPAVAPAKEPIVYDQFAAMDIRTGTIIAAEKVEKTKKLLKLTVDTGIDRRTVVSGIAEFFEPEAIIGQKVAILVNLEPRDLRGIPSQGMILMAEDGDGRLTFVNAGDSPANGSVIR